MNPSKAEWDKHWIGEEQDPRMGGREGGRGERGQVPLPSVTVTDTTVQLGRKEAGCQGRALLGPCQVCGDSGRCCPGGREETFRFGVSTRASD